MGRFEDTGTSIPAWLAQQRVCDTGETTCITDRRGNPLYLGREQRLFSPRQRLALAIRDGGCRWPGCDRPPSYCEAHHIDHYDRDEGRTDIDRGILLCRFHHMHLHHHGWHITRTRLEDFTLHPPEENRSPCPRSCTSDTPGQACNRHPDDSGPPPDSARADTGFMKAGGHRGCRSDRAG